MLPRICQMVIFLVLELIDIKYLMMDMNNELELWLKVKLAHLYGVSFEFEPSYSGCNFLFFPFDFSYIVGSYNYSSPLYKWRLQTKMDILFTHKCHKHQILSKKDGQSASTTTRHHQQQSDQLVSMTEPQRTHKHANTSQCHQ